jgi:hypothetical protein
VSIAIPALSSSRIENLQPSSGNSESVNQFEAGYSSPVDRCDNRRNIQFLLFVRVGLCPL